MPMPVTPELAARVYDYACEAQKIATHLRPNSPKAQQEADDLLAAASVLAHLAGQPFPPTISS